MIRHDWARCVFVLMLAAVTAGCQNAHVRLGTPPPPAPAPTYASPAEVPGGYITVRHGETIYDISVRTGSPMRDLIDANHLKAPYRLRAGTLLIVPRTRRYVVQRGDTLYSIAESQGVEIFSLARMNELSPPFAVRPGEMLKLPPSVKRPLVPLSPAKPAIRLTRVAPAGTREKFAPSLPPLKSAAVSSRAELSPPLLRGGRFIWPVRGRIIGRYGTTPAGTHNDGINIAAARGTPVRAAGAGVVVYAGNELRGYGNLVLIKHAGGWMTAYAHNEIILVHRGETVKRGQEIAKVGATGIVNQPQLHFEIRRGTRVLDPMEYLPTRQASASQ